MQKPLYEPTATIEIDPAGLDPDLREVAASDSNDAEYLETQAKKLASDDLLVVLIRTLDLGQNSDLLGSGKTSVFSRLDPLAWFAKPKKDSVAQASEQTGGAPQLSEPENVALRNIRLHLAIKRDTSSRLVTASFSSHDPRLAALVTNTLVNLFVEKSRSTRHDAILESSVWLSKQLDDVREAMQKSNTALAEYERVWGIADLGEDDKQQSTFTQKVAELNHELTLAQAERIQLEAYVNGIQAGAGDSLQQVGTDPVIQKLTQKLADVRTALSESMVVYGKNHPNVKKLQNEADELESQISAERKAIIARIQTSYRSANTHVKILSEQMRLAMEQASHMGQYNILKREAQANRELYNALYTHVKEASISAESKSSNIRVVGRARVLDRPTGPHRMLLAVAGLVVGLLGGIAFAFIKENLDVTVRDIDDVKRSTGVSGISIMPTFESTNGSRPGIPGLDFMSLPSRQNHCLAAASRLVLKRPRSPEAEALRSLQTSILMRRPGNAPQVIQIVSAFPGEGKTTIAVNLAVELSIHSKTCLLDADLRKPGVAPCFGLAPRQGLGEVLAGSLSVDAALINAPEIQNLRILPARALTGDLGPLFVSQSIQEILWTLRRQFQFVIIDSPPLIAYADGRAIAPFVDGLVLVGRCGYTTREGMAQTIELLKHINAAPVIEVVLNDAGELLLDPRYSYQLND